VCRLQILDISAQPDSVTSQQHEVDRVVAAPHLSLHHHLLAARHAAVWRPVRNHCTEQNIRKYITFSVIVTSQFGRPLELSVQPDV